MFFEHLLSLRHCYRHKGYNRDKPETDFERNGWDRKGASQVAQWVNNPPAVQEMRVQAPDPEDPLEQDLATHSTILAWRIPWTAEPGGLQSVALQRARQDWAAEHTCKKAKNSSKAYKSSVCWQHKKMILFFGHLYHVFFLSFLVFSKLIMMLKVWYFCGSE